MVRNFHMKNIVITGGAGFIGSHVVRLFVNKYPEYKIINLDKLTYAGNLANLKDIEDKPNYKFVKMDICDFDAFYKLMQDEKVDGIIHFHCGKDACRQVVRQFFEVVFGVLGFKIFKDISEPGQIEGAHKLDALFLRQLRQYGTDIIFMVVVEFVAELLRVFGGLYNLENFFEMSLIDLF